MIRNPSLIAAFERKLTQAEKADLEKNLRIIDALHEEAVSLGVFPPRDRLEGLEVDIRIAKVVTSVQRPA